MFHWKVGIPGRLPSFLRNTLLSDWSHHFPNMKAIAQFVGPYDSSGNEDKLRICSMQHVIGFGWVLNKFCQLWMWRFLRYYLFMYVFDVFFPWIDELGWYQIFFLKAEENYVVLQTRHPFIIGIFSREPDLRSLYDSIFFFSTDDLWNKTYSIPSPLGSCSDRRRRIDSMESFVTYVLNKGRYISSLHHFEWMEKTKAVDYLSNHSLGNQVDNERDWHLVKIVEWQFGFLS